MKPLLLQDLEDHEREGSSHPRNKRSSPPASSGQAIPAKSRRFNAARTSAAASFGPTESRNEDLALVGEVQIGSARQGPRLIPKRESILDQGNAPAQCASNEVTFLKEVQVNLVRWNPGSGDVRAMIKTEPGMSLRPDDRQKSRQAAGLDQADLTALGEGEAGTATQEPHLIPNQEPRLPKQRKAPTLFLSLIHI